VNENKNSVEMDASKQQKKPVKKQADGSFLERKGT
jgi:hypothetical protein